MKTERGPTVEYRGKYLYSKYNPEGGALKISQSIILQDNTIYFIISPLLEYGLRDLKCPDNSLFIKIEIDKNLYEITKDNNSVHLINTGFQFLKLLESINFSKYKKVDFIKLNGSYSLFQNAYDSLLKIGLNHLHNYWKNRYTLTQMGQLWLKNTITNLESLSVAKPLSELNTDKPVVVVGAGESNEKTLPLLIERRADVFILCVDTALLILLESGLIPDAVVALEAQFYNLPDFYGAVNKKIDLIYDLSSYPAVPFNLHGEKYYTVTKFSDSTLLDKIKDKRIADEFIPPLGSVGITAIYIALQITGNSIFLTGLDFSYKLGKTHCNGTPYHLSSLIKWNRLFPGDNYGACLKRPFMNKINKSGNYENTDSILFEYSLYARELLTGSKRVFDLTSTGMDLGVPMVTAADFDNLTTYNVNDDKEKNASESSNLSLELYKEIAGDLLEAINSIGCYYKNKTDFSSVKNSVNRVSYLFDFYPEAFPMEIFSEKSLNRFYYTLIRFKRLLGL